MKKIVLFLFFSITTSVFGQESLPDTIKLDEQRARYQLLQPSTLQYLRYPEEGNKRRIKDLWTRKITFEKNDDKKIMILEQEWEAQDSTMNKTITSSFEAMTMRPLTQELLSWKDSINNGQLLGPELKVAGPLIDGKEPLWGQSHDGPIVMEPEKVDGIVANQKAQGYDLIKLYERLPKEVYLQFLESAKEKKFRAAGYVPFAFLSNPEVDEVFTASSPSFEHFKNFGPFVTTAEIEKDEQPKDILYYGYGLAANPDSLKISKVVSKIKEHDIWICPTSVLWRNSADSLRISNLVNDKPFQKIDSGLKNWWLSTKSHGKRDVDVSTLSEHFLQEMARQDVKLLAGTDFPNPFLIPGYSLHQEIHSIADMGYSNLEALKSATIYPAQYWDQMDRKGYLQAGRLANLLVLDKNPLEDIRHTLKIDQVIYKGQFFNPAELIEDLE